MSLGKSLLSGAAGAASLNLIHESARRVIPSAPRVDVVGKSALRRYLPRVGVQPPDDERSLYAAALGGDLISNAAYYSLVGVGEPEGAVQRGTALGLLGGLGAVFLPPLLGLSQEPVARSTSTAVMTVIWYTLGGYAAGLVRRVLG